MNLLVTAILLSQVAPGDFFRDRRGFYMDDGVGYLPLAGGTITGDICLSNVAGPCLRNEAATATNPTVTDSSDATTGVGFDSSTVWITAAGTNVMSGTASQASFNINTVVDARFAGRSASTTCADDGAGTAAACAVSTTSVMMLTVVCNDANGCDLTLNEASALTAQFLFVINSTANVVNLIDVANVQETAATALGQWDGATLVYSGARWVQVGASNN